MKKTKSIMLSLAALLLLSTTAMVLPAYAQGDDKSKDNTTERRTKNKSGVSGPIHDEMDASKKSSPLAEQFHKQGDEKIKALRAQDKQRSQAERQKNCTNRKVALNNKMNQKIINAERHKAFFDKVYAKVKNYHDSNQLNVPNYDNLAAKVGSAQEGAQANIDALKALDVNIDCTSQIIGDSVSAFQQAVKATRDSLKEYRTSLHDLMKAVRQTAEEKSTDRQ